MKSLTRIHADDWAVTPATTNSGESQHHWTNLQTGTRLSLLEAIEKYVCIMVSFPC